MKKILAIVVVIIIVTGCTDKKSFTVTGSLNNTDNSYIYINRLDVDTPVRIDSAKIGKKGGFHFTVKATAPDFYQIGFSGSDFITILAEPGEKIELSFPNNKLFDEYSVTGSQGTAKIKMLDSALAETKKRIDSLQVIYENSFNTPGFDSVEKSVSQYYVKILKDQRLFNIDFILKNLRSFASIKALYQRIDENTYVLYDSRDVQFMKLVSDTLTRYYPESKQAKSLKRNFDSEKSRFIINRIGQMANEMPESKLDPSLKDMSGKRITLSSLKGKYVLLTFWSAASEDCVKENLDLKSFYKKYKNLGFEIYQVNLDLNEETWKNAVKFDELPWISVREDDPANPRNATLFNVRVLPANYLFDREGNIIAMNLHGRALQIKLSQIFGM